MAASAAGRQCQVTRLTAVGFSASGTPLAAASCDRPGVVGIFARSGDTWESAGLALGGQLAGKPVQVLRLTGTSAGTVALLQAGTGSAADLLAAWSSDEVQGGYATTGNPATHSPSVARHSG